MRFDRAWHVDAWRIDAAPGDDVVALEDAYARRLGKVTRAAVRATTEQLESDMGDVLGLGGLPARRRMVTRANRIARAINKALPRKLLEQDAEQQAARVFLASGRRWRTFAREQGVDRDVAQLGNDLDPGDAVKRFKARQVAAVRKAVEAHRAGLVRELRGRLKPGASVEALQELVRERVAVLESRLENVARNETQALLGELDAMRHRAAGVEEYEWRTQGDGAVRPSHRERDRKIFRWDDPPAGGHPGEDWGCRCWAEPVIKRAESGPELSMASVPKGASTKSILAALETKPIVQPNPSRSLASHLKAYEGATPEQVQAIARGELPTMGGRTRFDPVRIVVQPGSPEGFDDIVISDGNHRIAAAKAAGATHVLADIKVVRGEREEVQRGVLLRI